MKPFRPEPRIQRDSLAQVVGIACLVLMAGFAIFGPSGILAWGENQRMLAERQVEMKQLSAQRDEMRNRVALLDPRHADPDLTGELLRRDLNVVHPDEMVMLLR